VIERIASGRTDLVFDHLEAGGEPGTVDEVGVSLASWCAYYGDASALRALLRHGARLEDLGDNYDLNGAAFHGHWQLTEFLLERGADPDLADADTGETPLHAALCKAGRPAYERVVRVLLTHGADPNRSTKVGAETGCFMRDARTRGETPLHRAAAFGTEPTIRLLLDAGADVEARDANGDTPLSWASWHLRPDAILRLLLHGDHTLHPERDSTYDHGQGWGALDDHLLGRPGGQ